MDDEISLADLFRSLWRQRCIIAISILLFTLGTGLYAFLKPVQYNYNTALEVGSYPVLTEDGPDRRLIEPSANVARKLKLAYIPLARSQFKESNFQTVPQVSLSKETDSRLFILTSTGTVEAQSVISELHQRILDLLVDDNNRALRNLTQQQQSSIRSQQAKLNYQNEEAVRQASLKVLEEKLQKTTQKLASLDQEHAVKLAKLNADQKKLETELLDNKAIRNQLSASIKRTSEREQLLKEEIDSIKHRIAQLQKERALAMAQSPHNGNAVALLMMGNELSQAERRLWTLRNSLTIDIKAELEELTRQLTTNQGAETQLQARLEELSENREEIIAKLPGEKAILEAEIDRLANEVKKRDEDNQLEMSQLEESVQRLQFELDDMRPTAALYIAAREIDPQGPSKTILIALGCLLGLMAGILLAIIIEITKGPNATSATKL